MAKDQNGGLLSKVVKFVRNPTTNWADLDQQESDRESSYSKQMLKEMIERKRRNDFVRKREFDMLRKMRRREALVGQDFAARPSFFQSSMPSKPDDRAMTLKKIDEIEAQMSMQWWKTKNGDSSARSGGFPMSGESIGDISSDPSPLSPPDGSHYARTDPAPLIALKDAGQPAPEEPAAPVNGKDSGLSAFTASKLTAVEVDELAHDPELEEASIRFANGDDAGAEAGLLEALGSNGTRGGHDETWLTLFDLYRATGQQERFETAAIDFAGRFGRSAPQWFSIPELVGKMARPGAAAPSARATDWTSPSVLGIQSLAALQAALERVQPPWRLDWSRLAAVEAAAVEPLCKLFARWNAQPVQLRFIGGDVLDNVFKAATPPGDKSVSQALWRLRMEALRLMNRADEFELAALNYCVTYEVSPPSWERARCDYKALDAQGGELAGYSLASEASPESLLSTISGAADFHASAMNGLTSGTAIVDMAGQVLGDATAVLEQLNGKLQGADLLVISCARLVRVDFSAAGTLLNWVSSRQAEGRQVQFSDVHRLVAAFFNVIGISECARVIPRSG